MYYFLFDYSPLNMLQSKCDINLFSYDWVMKSLSRKWKDWKAHLKAKFYNPSLSAAQQHDAMSDERVIPEQYEVLVSFWNSDEAKVKYITYFYNFILIIL